MATVDLFLSSCDKKCTFIHAWIVAIAMTRGSMYVPLIRYATVYMITKLEFVQLYGKVGWKQIIIMSSGM